MLVSSSKTEKLFSEGSEIGKKGVSLIFYRKVSSFGFLGLNSFMGIRTFVSFLRARTPPSDARESTRKGERTSKRREEWGYI